MFIRVLLYSLVLTTTAVAQAPNAAAQTSAPGSIEGKVLASDGAPLQQATVKLTRRRSAGEAVPAARPQSIAAETDGEGKFAIAAIGAGNYSMSVTRAGYIPDQLRMTIVPAANTVTVKLTAESVIEGRTLDENGDPMGNMQVEVLQKRYTQQDGWSFGEVKATISGADGRYSIGELSAGRYYVSAADPVASISVRYPPANPNPLPEVVTTYYPSGTALSTAAGVDVPASGTARGIDIRLQRMAVYRVNGKVAVSGGTLGVSGLKLMPADSDLLTLTVPTTAIGPGNDSFQFQHVQPGAYTVYYKSHDGNSSVPLMVGFEDVIVSNKDVEDFVLHISPPRSMSGRLRTEGQVTPQPNLGQPAKAVTVYLYPGELTGSSSRNTVNADGSFVLAGVGPGIYGVRVTDMPPGTYVKQVRYGNQDVTDRRFRIAGSLDDLEVVLSTGAATLKVQANGERTDANPVVLWSPSNPTLNRLVAKGASIPNLPPGEYRLLELDLQGAKQDLIATSPEFMNLVAGQSITVKLGERDNQTVAPKILSKAAFDQAISKLR